MTLTGAQRTALRHLLDRLVPADDHPSGVEAGVEAWFERRLEVDPAQAAWIGEGLAALDGEARVRGAAEFRALDSAAADDLLRALERGDAHTSWPRGAPRFMRGMAQLAAEGYYGQTEAGWRMVGFRPGAAPGSDPSPRAYAPPRSARAADLAPFYDAIVVGAGAAGGVAAAVLSEAGARVLLVEAGPALDDDAVGRDHLHNQRFPRYGHNAGPEPDGNPRVAVGPDGVEREVAPREPAYQNNASCLGGGTRVFGAQAWRLLPEDFRMRTLYGRPDGSSLEDWPLDYADLAPSYEWVEWNVGVAGDARAHRRSGARSRDYPLPPVPANPERELLARGARALGWSAGPVPLAINTRPRAGRPACVQCGTCVGFACPSNAKNGTHNTLVPRALATGSCTLLCNARVSRIELDARGAASGVSLVVDQADGARALRVRAGRVVTAAGAIESARLLLNSACAAQPLGLGNDSDQVGRHLQGHVYAGAIGVFDRVVKDGLGPGVSIATCEFNHGNRDVIGGGMLANEFIPLPIMFWSLFLPPELPRWGLANKRAMAELYPRTTVVMGPTHEIPSPDARVRVDLRVRDRHELPVARLSGTVHAETLRTATVLSARAQEWLLASDAKSARTFVGAGPRTLSAGQHQAGTCRMGDDPRTSVTDRNGRVHGVAGLYVADGSLHVTNGGFNPALTIMALAHRVSSGIVAEG